MTLEVSSLAVGKSYLFDNGYRRIIEIKDNDDHEWGDGGRVTWEYTDGERGGRSGGECSLYRFAEIGQKDYLNDPEYEGIGQFVLVCKQGLQRGKAIKTLNRRLVMSGEKMPRKTAIKILLDKGYRVTGRNSKRRLEYNGSTVPSKIITKTGLDYAEFLSLSLTTDNKP